MVGHAAGCHPNQRSHCVVPEWASVCIIVHIQRRVRDSTVVLRVWTGRGLSPQTISQHCVAPGRASVYIIVHHVADVSSTVVLRVGQPPVATSHNPHTVWRLDGPQCWVANMSLQCWCRSERRLHTPCSTWAYCVSDRPSSCQVAPSGCDLALYA